MGEAAGSHDVDGIIGISERIVILNLKPPGYKDPWSIIQAYSPTEQTEIDEIEMFYHTLSETVLQISLKTWL